MKKIIISEKQKHDILKEYYNKKLINEAPIPKINLGRLFGSSVDDIFKGYGDDVIKSLDDVFAKLFRNPVNLTTLEGVQAVKSASGAVVKLQTIKDAIEAVASGKAETEWVLTTFPNKLADGTEFRKVIIDGLKSKGQSQISNLGKQFRSMATQMNGWMQIKEPIGNMSGWKFHVYADNLDDTAFLYERLLPVINKHGAGMKVASSPLLQRLSVNPLQKGKAVTIYLPSSVFSKNTQREFLKEIQDAIKGYEKSGQIAGDEMITKNIGYRYELSEPINPAKGVDRNQYSVLYKPNEGGPYNIKGNPDMFSSQPNVVSNVAVQNLKNIFVSGKQFNTEILKQNENLIQWDKINAGYYNDASKTSITYIRDLPNRLEYYIKWMRDKMKSGEFDKISSKGFENFGIDNMRDFLKYKVNPEKNIVDFNGGFLFQIK